MAETQHVADGSSGAAVQLPPFKWHLLLCADQTKPKCCKKPAGLESWVYLKKRIKELGLDSGTEQVHRSKVNCLRGCDYQIPGPVLLMYPGGYWYRAATPEAIERILQEHVLGGTPVEELLVAQTPLQESPDVVSTSNTVSPSSSSDEFFHAPPTEPVAIADAE